MYWDTIAQRGQLLWPYRELLPKHDMPDGPREPYALNLYDDHKEITRTISRNSWSYMQLIPDAKKRDQEASE